MDESQANVLMWAVGSIIALIAVYIAYLQLKKSSPKPELLLQFNYTSLVHISGFSTGQLELGQLYRDKDLMEHDTHSILHSIENIGPGMAKDLVIDWEFEWAWAFKAIERATKAPYKLDLYAHSLAIIDSAGNTTVDTLTDPEHSQITYDFIPPRSEEKFDKSPSLPLAIINLMTIYFLQRRNLIDMPYIDEQIMLEDFEGFPKPVAVFSYRDLDGRKYKSRFEVSVSLSTGLLDSSIDLIDIDVLELNVYLEVKKIK